MEVYSRELSLRNERENWFKYTVAVDRERAGTRAVSFHIRRREWPRGSRLQEKKGSREKGGKFSLKYKGNISTPLDGEFAWIRISSVAHWNQGAIAAL